MTRYGLTRTASSTTRFKAVVLLLAVGGVLGFSLPTPAALQDPEPEKSAEKVDFQKDIQPILAKRCHECHGEEKEEGDLRTDQRESVLDEYFLTPGKADESLFYKVIVSSEDDRMPPPDEGEAVPAEEAALIKAWIDQGAVWPEGEGGGGNPPPPSQVDGADATITKPAAGSSGNPPQKMEAEAGKAPPAGDQSGSEKSAAAPVNQPGNFGSAADANNQEDAAAKDSTQTQQPGAGEASSTTPKPTANQESAATVPAPPAAKKLTARQEYWLKVWRAFGELHPATAHFPIALLIVGGLAALFSFRGSYACADFAFYCLWLGALSALVAAGLGWSFAWNEGHNEDPFQFDRAARLFWHRWTGVALAVLSLLAALVATVSRRRDPENGSLWRFGLIALAVLTAYVGHAGGELTHRRGYGKIWDLFGLKQGNAPAATAQDDQAADRSP